MGIRSSNSSSVSVNISFLYSIMQPLCTSNCVSMVLLVICITLALNVYNMRKANATMSEEFTASNKNYTDAKHALTKCEHDLKSQETVLVEIKAAVEDAKKQNTEVQGNLDRCKSELDKKKNDQVKAAKDASALKEEGKKAEETVTETVQEKKGEKKEDKEKESAVEKKEEKAGEKKDDKQVEPKSL